MDSKKIFLIGVGCGFLGGYFAKKVLYRDSITKLNHDWELLKERTELHLSSINKVLLHLQVGEYDEAEKLWNEHVEFMTTVEIFHE